MSDVALKSQICSREIDQGENRYFIPSIADMLGDFGRPLANIVRSDMSTKDEDFRDYRVEEIRRGTADLKTLAAQLNGQSPRYNRELNVR
jgi:hypothetical protein